MHNVDKTGLLLVLFCAFANFASASSHNSHMSKVHVSMPSLANQMEDFLIFGQWNYA